MSRRIASRAEVYHAGANSDLRTSGGLRYQDLFKDEKTGRIRSVLASKVQKENYAKSERAQKTLKENAFKLGHVPPPSKQKGVRKQKKKDK